MKINELSSIAIVKILLVLIAYSVLIYLYTDYYTLLSTRTSQTVYLFLNIVPVGVLSVLTSYRYEEYNKYENEYDHIISYIISNVFVTLILTIIIISSIYNDSKDTINDVSHIFVYFSYIYIFINLMYFTYCLNIVNNKKQIVGNYKYQYLLYFMSLGLLYALPTYLPILLAILVLYISLSILFSGASVGSVVFSTIIFILHYINIVASIMADGIYYAVFACLVLLNLLILFFNKK